MSEPVLGSALIPVHSLRQPKKKSTALPIIKLGIMVYSTSFPGQFSFNNIQFEFTPCKITFGYQGTPKFQQTASLKLLRTVCVYMQKITVHQELR